jgi:predicted ATP-dependent serine protease
VERKDKDLEGCRVLETVKNRFGGCGHTFYLALNDRGFQEVARVSAA